MKKIDNHKFYLDSFKKYGISAKGTRWNSKQNQYIRFEKLLEPIENNLSSSSLLDIGCGFGELISYFQEKNIYPKSYIGIDCEDFMIRNSQKRFPNSSFFQKNFLSDLLPQSDYYLCSGAFNTLSKDEIFKAVKLCYLQCSKGFVFNFLQNSFVHNLNAFDLYLYCKELSKKVKMESSYLENDYTFYLEK